jgi:hypothetical protein
MKVNSGLEGLAAFVGSALASSSSCFFLNLSRRPITAVVGGVKTQTRWVSMMLCAVQIYLQKYIQKRNERMAINVVSA